MKGMPDIMPHFLSKTLENTCFQNTKLARIHHVKKNFFA